jgi:hypothetical protein
MTFVKKTIACFCENTFEADIPDSVDLAAEPAVINQVLSGDFMALTCPLCGKRLTPEFPCLFVDAPGERDIFFVPELDRIAYLRGRLEYDVGDPWRVAIGFPELVEKLRVITKGLDDRVIEIMKYYLATRTSHSESGKTEQQGEMGILFNEEESDALVFHVTGLRKDEIGVARLRRDIYRKIEADIEKRVLDAPFKEFCDPPYVSLKRII